MDDFAFESWSQTLAGLRRTRREDIDRLIQEKADSFKPADFYQMAQRSIDNVMDRWFSAEQDSWVSNPPSNTVQAMQTARSEMESVFEFELESIDRDANYVVTRITWLPNELEAAQRDFQNLTEDLRKKYQVKLKSLSIPPGEIKMPVGADPLKPVQFSTTSGRSGGGLGVIIMFIVGLVMGGSASFYFLDQQRKAEARFQDEREKLLADQRALADSMALFHDSFVGLATGRTRSIPELKEEAARLRRELDLKRSDIKQEYARRKEQLTRKVSSEDRLAEMSAEIDKQRDAKLAALNTREKPALDIVEKQILVLEELMGPEKKP